MIVFLFACSIVSNEKSSEMGAFENGWNQGVLTQIGSVSGSAFLVEADKNGITLIDAGHSLSDNPMVAFIEDQGRSVEDVTKIFITHGHNSHVTGLPLCPNAAVYALSNEVAHLSTKGITIDVPLADGDVIALGNSEIEVFATSGHTEGNAAFRVDDLLIVGDTAIALSDGSVEAITGNADDPVQASLSLETLGDRLRQRESEFSTTLFSHSGPLPGIEAILDYRHNE